MLPIIKIIIIIQKIWIILREKLKMTIPNYQDFMEPVLKCFLNFENGARITELYDDVANILKISEEEKINFYKVEDKLSLIIV